MTTYTQDITSFTDQREWPWVTLGEDVSGAMSLEEALAKANLNDWNVRTESIITVDSGIVPPHAYATVRDGEDGSPLYLGDGLLLEPSRQNRGGEVGAGVCGHDSSLYDGVAPARVSLSPRAGVLIKALRPDRTHDP